MASLEPHKQREFAVEIVGKLRAAGYEAYWAGGCVRDHLLGRVPKDFDVATSARPDEIRELFGRRRTLALGAAFGVITVLGPAGAGQIEIATFRQDASYSDGRHPDAVTFSTPEADAQRRDFTINGLFFDPERHEVIDFVGGRQDLAHRVIRAIGDASARFREDKLRLLRAVRFAATFEFDLDPATHAAVAEMAGQINVVSAERIAAELRLILAHENRRRGVELLVATGLLAQILPEVDPQGLAWSQLLRTLELLGEAPFPLALAALIEPAAAQIENPAQLIEALGRRLKLSGAEIARAAWLTANQPALLSACELPWPRLQRLLVAEGASELVALAAARATATGTHQADVELCREKLLLPAAEFNPPPLVSGNDLIAHGLRPGPQFQRLLEQVRDAQLERQIDSRAAALALIDRLRAEKPAQ